MSCNTFVLQHIATGKANISADTVDAIANTIVVKQAKPTIIDNSK